MYNLKRFSKWAHRRQTSVPHPFYLSVYLSGFVEHTLCTTSMVQSYVVQQPPALCTMVHKGDLVLLGVNTPGEVQAFEPILASCKSDSHWQGVLTSMSSCLIFYHTVQCIFLCKVLLLIIDVRGANGNMKSDYDVLSVHEIGTSWLQGDIRFMSKWLCSLSVLDLSCSDISPHPL